MRVTIRLETPPIGLVAPPGVFDDFGWCASDELTWGRSAGRPFDTQAAITSANPPGMVFVLREECTFLPREMAALHAPGMGFRDEPALAPWAIDDATDTLHERRARPRDWIVELATSAIDGLFWGLHDWAHFHNHGPFERRAWTEMQCDTSALVWLWKNRAAIGIDETTWERVRAETVEVARARFAEEGEAFDARLLDAARIQLVARTTGS